MNKEVYLILTLIANRIRMRFIEKICNDVLLDQDGILKVCLRYTDIRILVCAITALNENLCPNIVRNTFVFNISHQN